MCSWIKTSWKACSAYLLDLSLTKIATNLTILQKQPILIKVVSGVTNDVVVVVINLLIKVFDGVTYILG